MPADRAVPGSRGSAGGRPQWVVTGPQGRARRRPSQGPQYVHTSREARDQKVIHRTREERAQESISRKRREKRRRRSTRKKGAAPRLETFQRGCSTSTTP
eukprot:5715911-Pyramimonas_sp.AAC.1